MNGKNKRDEERTAQAPGNEALAEFLPVARPLPLTRADIEQDPLAVGREAPGDEDALPRTLGPDGQ